jgi:hypothetical protein
MFRDCPLPRYTAASLIGAYQPVAGQSQLKLPPV